MELKALTRSEVVAQLNALPDYPVVIERDTDELRSTVITSIKVKDAYNGAPNEYCDYYGMGKNYEKVIWIS